MTARIAVAALAATITLGVSALGVGADTGYQFRVVASGLSRPTGIAVGGWRTLYFTEVPTPGVAGGLNGVSSLDLDTGAIAVLHRGEPEPTNIAVSRDDEVYWTCMSAGVILKRDEDGGIAPILTGLRQPSGISVSTRGTVYFTEVPTPGVPGGDNTVSSFDGTTKAIVSSGEPEPTDVVVSRHGSLYWTCKSAGVILTRRNGQTSVLLSGLDHPTGIALDGDDLYFTEVPTPGVAGKDGGRNAVSVADVWTRRVRVIHTGDPEPTDVAVAKNGTVYWTCSSAGVIVEARPRGRHGRD
jgi:streptogramin lyase